MSLFNKRQRVNSKIELEGYKGNYYLNCGLRRVYSTQWCEIWRRWEQDHGALGSSGEALTCIRPVIDGRRTRSYYDMSRCDIDIQHIDPTAYDPVHTKYMSSNYIDDKSLEDVAHMPTDTFERFIGSLGHRHGDGRKK